MQKIFYFKYFVKIPNNMFFQGKIKKKIFAKRYFYIGLGCWWGKSSTKPFLSLVGLRDQSATLGLRHGPDFNKAAVRNIGQWEKSWSSNTERVSAGILFSGRL